MNYYELLDEFLDDFNKTKEIICNKYRLKENLVEEMMLKGYTEENIKDFYISSIKANIKIESAWKYIKTIC